MRESDFVSRMWIEALEQLERAERLERQFFTPSGTPGRRFSWAPPVDVFEDAKNFIVQVALPDVRAETIDYRLTDHMLVVGGERRLPRTLSAAVVRRMELPQGRFERHIAIPAFQITEAVFENGCLTLVLEK